MRRNIDGSEVANSGAVISVSPQVLHIEKRKIRDCCLRRKGQTYANRVLPPGSDPWRFSQIEEHVCGFIEGVYLEINQ